MELLNQLLILVAVLAGIIFGTFFAAKCKKESLEIKLNHKERFKFHEYRLRLYTNFIRLSYETKKTIISPARSKQKVAKVSSLLRELDNAALEIQLFCSKDVFKELFALTNVFKNLYKFQKDLSYKMASKDKSDRLNAIGALEELSKIDQQTNIAIKKFISAIRKELKIKFQLQ